MLLTIMKAGTNTVPRATIGASGMGSPPGHAKTVDAKTPAEAGLGIPRK